MRFFPHNRHLHVEILNNLQEQSKFIPEELRQKMPFTAVKLKNKAKESLLSYEKGDILVVRTEGLEKIKYNGSEFDVVSEIHVVGHLEN